MSLIEVMVVVSILAVMVTLAIQGTGLIRDQKLAAASRELMADFQRVRQEAMTQGAPRILPVAGALPDLTLNRGFGIRFASNASYVPFEFIEASPGNFQYDGVAEEFEETGKRDASNTRIAPVAKTLPTSVTVTNGAVTNPTGDILLYDRRGILRNTDLTIRTGNIVYVLKISNGSSRPRCISIDPVRIREGVWDGVNCLVS